MATFDWSNGKLPPLEPHSQAKLNVLGDYVTDYVCILCRNSYGREVFKISLVDGFAGGGAYQGGKLGSPFVLMSAVAAAETKINSAREKPLAIDCHYYFVEKDPANFACLRSQLEQSIFKDQIGRSIFLLV
jgi:three-Cys-motif partner protein